MKKKILLFASMLCSASVFFGQSKTKVEPFIISGRITDCPENTLFISFKNDDRESMTDTIHLDQDGNFYLKTFKVKSPQKTRIQQNRITIELFVAPGYNLKITGNGKDYLSLLRTKKITGIGSESNQYQFLLDSIHVARMDTTRWFSLNESELLAYIKSNSQLQDSVANIVFRKKATQDKYFKYFGKTVELDNEFSRLSMLLTFINYHRSDYEKSVAFLKNNTDNRFLSNPFKDEYMMSDEYKDAIIDNEYLNYLVKLECLKDSMLCNKMNHKLEIINKIYKGSAKEYSLFDRMTRNIYLSESFAELNEYKQQFVPYIAALRDPSDKASINTKISEKETQLLRTQTGMPAPAFRLEDNLGNAHSMEDFKGKVVYLDLWASWCGPCRAETPDFKILYEKYKANSQVAFISIAVQDGKNEWKKALEEDKPIWLQLIDKQGVVWNSYVGSSIPKFILIDKQGNIVNFDSPRPSSGKEIEDLLNQQIAK